MNEEKYYTPIKEDFHVGFEYEWKNSDGFPYDIFQRGVVKTGIQIDDIHGSDNGVDKTYILRVKYLDNSDVESIGWDKKLDFIGYGLKYANNIFILTGVENSHIIEIKKKQQHRILGDYKK